MSKIPEWVDKEAWEEYEEGVNRRGRIDKFLSKTLDRLAEAITSRSIDLSPLTWDDVEHMTVTLADKVKQDYKPDSVVGVRKAGSLIAPRLASELDLTDVQTLDIIHYSGIFNHLSTAWIAGLFKKARVKGNDLYVAGKRVLLVDDDACSGKTMRVGEKYILEENHAYDVKTASLYTLNPKNVDYHVKLGFGNYPWYQIKR